MHPIIKTSYGSVKGVRKVNCYEKPYLAFHAIPYAKQPIGEFRFKDARPLESWGSVLDATKVGDACWNNDRINPYPEEKKIIGSDNCLHLNIYVPDVNPTKTSKLPVMLYLHGGRFATMSATPFYYGPDYLMERNVILVTINYRLGAFGFLSLNDKDLQIPGNAGIKDQLMALKWVKSEIENFGGDPENITLFGESAGGCMTHYHLLSDRSKGLFKRAIIMSGSAFGPWSVRPNHDYAYRLANVLGYEGSVDDEKAIYKFLLDADPVRIVEVQDSLLDQEEKLLGQFNAFGPVLEPYITDKTIIYAHPFKMSQNAWGNEIDVMIGGCSMEGLLLYKYISPKAMASLDFSAVVAQNVHLDRHSQECIAKGQKLRRFYYGNEPPSINNYDNFIDIQTDKIFWHGMWMAMKARSSAKPSKTFIYRFDVEPTSNTTIREHYQIPHQRGACHVEDIFYIFKAEYLEAPVKGSFEHQIMKVMTGAFTAFARDGNPKCKELGNVDWNPAYEGSLDERNVKCLNISKDLSCIVLPETKRMFLWDEICQNKF